MGRVWYGIDSSNIFCSALVVIIFIVDQLSTQFNSTKLSDNEYWCFNKLFVLLLKFDQVEKIDGGCLPPGGGGVGGEGTPHPSK